MESVLTKIFKVILLSLVRLTQFISYNILTCKLDPHTYISNLLLMV